MDVSDAKRLKELADENRRLKRLVADQMLESVIRRELGTFPIPSQRRDSA